MGLMARSHHWLDDESHCWLDGKATVASWDDSLAIGRGLSAIGLATASWLGKVPVVSWPVLMGQSLVGWVTASQSLARRLTARQLSTSWDGGAHICACECRPMQGNKALGFMMAQHKNTKHELGSSQIDPLSMRSKCGPYCHQQLHTMTNNTITRIIY